MKTSRIFSFALLMALILFANPIFAQKRYKVVKKTPNKKVRVVHNKNTHKTHVVKKTSNAKHHVVKTTKVVRPALGARVHTLPAGHKRIVVGKANYYYHLGSYYHWNATSRAYLVVRPPINTIVTTIPTGYTVVKYRGINHYVLNGIYYRPEFRNGSRIYVVARV